MKKAFYTILSFLIPLVGINAQSLVSTGIEKRVVVLEEYTGVNCGYCPDGHRIAESMKADDPDNVVIINIHAGGFANPSGSQPDFRTSFGQSLVSEMGVSGYPSGTVNRITFPDGTALSRAAWRANANTVKPQTSPVNVGVESLFDEATRNLTVNVELYYSDDSKVNNDFIHVAFLQNGVIGFQSDYANGNQQNYEHNKIFRHFLTGQWGDSNSENSAGSRVSRTYNWTVPADYNIEDCDIVAFVSESRRNIYTGKKISANNGSTVVVSSLEVAPGSNYLSLDKGESRDVEIGVNNFLSDSDSYDITVDLEGPASWSAQATLGGAAVTTIDVDGNTEKDVALTVNTGNEPGIGAATISFKSKAFPQAKPLDYTVNVISGVTDLVISNSEAETYAIGYVNGLEAAGNTGTYGTSPTTMIGFLDNDALSDVNNVYFNIGWTFPGLTDDVVDALSSFLDAGGNLFVAGQDIGWDTWESAGNGTTKTQAFYQNYLNADYLGDGSSSNGSIKPVAGDEVFRNVGTSNIRDIYGGGNIYPEELSAINGAQAIFNYGSGTKVGGIRYTDGNYKVVYLGFNLEQLSNSEVGEKIMKNTHNWFYGLSTSTEELELLSSSVFPNPTSDQFTLSLENKAEENLTIRLFDTNGQLIKVDYMSKGQTSQTVNTAELNTGMYLMELSGESNKLVAKSRVSVIK